jgi:hypothetical protein
VNSLTGFVLPQPHLPVHVLVSVAALTMPSDVGSR